MPLSSSRIATIALPSVDPPGEKCKLLPPYDQPPFKRGALTAERIGCVSSMNPLSRLHRSLIPDMNAMWKPPMFFYGWSIGDLLPRLLAYAEEHKLTRYTVIGKVHKPTTPSGEKLYESDDDSDDSDSDVSRIHWGDTDDEDDEEDDEEGGVVLDEIESAQNALWAMAREAGVPLRHLHTYNWPFSIRGALHYPSHFVISLYSNYELDRTVPEEDVIMVQKYLGIQEAPAWYVSGTNSTWERVAPRF
ncbi:hypothetical protein DAEQUDRAFT_730232 [Daedalea quercina L-15889]|uniref:Uncharacterized protein n=1 Tax=Daedalea quercina L-15889 TaxID=1314783 RepID=A0A165N4Y5_9APHY|nr:hypothetical protein DAEQUDRAFT_730232 [Daedalea quercina L-15889]